jgi:hypothetical protein
MSVGSKVTHPWNYDVSLQVICESFASNEGTNSKKYKNIVTLAKGLDNIKVFALTQGGNGYLLPDHVRTDLLNVING